MSAADRLEDGFPHGTPAGYAQGCRSNGACPSKRETGQSCKDANVRVARDGSYRALVKAGAPVSVLAQPEVEAQRPTEAPAPRPAPHAATPKLLRPKPTTKRTRDGVHPGRRRNAAQHGTYSGYQAGCRDNCPGGTDGKTCREAQAEYSRDFRARKKAQQAAALADPPTEEESATPPPRDTPTTPEPIDHIAVITFGEPAAPDAHVDRVRFEYANGVVENEHSQAPQPEQSPWRSPEPVTPFDTPSGLVEQVTYAAYRVVWLDGYHHGKAHS